MNTAQAWSWNEAQMNDIIAYKLILYKLSVYLKVYLIINAFTQ